MIADKKPKNKEYQKTKAQDVSDLARYIRNAHAMTGGREEEPEKVLCSGAFNFTFDDENAQIAEMTALAGETKGDPIDHWVLSWQSGEEPTPTQIEESVKIFLEECGMADHQAIYGAHQNTDNIHVHIQLNRIDPTSRKLEKINNGFDKRVALKALCRIEALQGWTPENNSLYIMTPEGPQERPDFVRSISPYAAGIERKTGIQSLETRARALAGEVKEATSWQDLHRRLAAHGASYEKRKGGAVIKFQGQGFVKASKCCREASLSALQKRLGTFERSQGPAPVPYEPKPPQIRPDLDLVSLVAAVLLSLFGFHALATQLLYKKQALERYQLRLQKFHSVQARWASQSVLKEEHKDQRDSLKAEQDKEIQAVKKMSHSELLNFSAEKQFLKQEKNEEKMQKIPAFLKNNPDAAPKAPAPEAPALEAFKKIHAALGAERYRFTVPHDDKPALLADASKEEKAEYQKQYGMFSVDKARRAEHELVTGKTGKLVSPGFTVEELRNGAMKDIVKIYTDPTKGMYMTILSDSVSFITVDDVNTQEKIQKAK